MNYKITPPYWHIEKYITQAYSLGVEFSLPDYHIACKPLRLIYSLDNY